MPKTFSSHTQGVLSLRKQHSNSYRSLILTSTKNSSEFAVSSMKMGNLTSMCCFNSKANSSVATKGSSTWYPKPGQHISIRTFRELRAVQMLNSTWRKTETSLILEFSKSTEDQIEAVLNVQMTHMPKQSIQAMQHRPSIY
nr:AC4 protein [Kudzu mosaic virus]